MFATNLRRLRHEKGLSQDDLAYEAEVSRSYLAQLEKAAYFASPRIVGGSPSRSAATPDLPLPCARLDGGGPARRDPLAPSRAPAS